MPKIPSLDYDKRIFEIQGWIINGVQSALIVKQILDAGWSNAKKECDRVRLAKRMLADARNRWTDIEEGKIEQKRKIRISKLEQYQRSLNEKYKGTPGGIRALVAAEKLIIELEGSKAPTKVEVAGNNGQPIQVEASQVILYLPENGR